LIFTPNNIKDKEEDIKMFEDPSNETSREDFDSDVDDKGDKG
jgi:hypothetical protein